MRVFHWLIISLIFTAASSWAQPTVNFDTTEVDFGYAYPGEALVHDFVITNKGHDPLQILDVQTSCGCTAAIPSATSIPAGATTVLSVTMTTTSSPTMYKTATVRTNDPKNLAVRLGLRARIHQVWSFTPRNSFHFGQVSFGNSEEQTIFIDNRDGNQYRILGAKLNNDAFTHQIGAYVEGKGYPVKVTFTAPQEEKFVSDILTLRTNDPRQPIVRINLASEVVGPIQFSPARLFFGTVQKGEQVTREVTMRALKGIPNQKLTIKEIQAEPNLIDGEVLQINDDGSAKLRFVFTAPDSIGLERGKVYIKTNSQQIPEAVLNFTAVVR